MQVFIRNLPLILNQAMSEIYQAEDIRQLTEKVKRKKLLIFSSETGNQQSYYWTGIHGRPSFLVGLLGNGHVLLEGVPGLAKTLAIKTLADAVHGDFSRIQFTPDLLPADVVGTMIYNIKDNDFSIKKDLYLRTLFWQMRSTVRRQSTVSASGGHAGKTGDDWRRNHEASKTVLVLATQNPIDQEGTYLLPEAQSDRFMLKCTIDYPAFEDERQVMRMVSTSHQPTVKPVISFRIL